ncbi:von Willebrand factor A domain-containing protein 3A [Hoplias malabaricus]|uniref:von Willebrand factor A domain-containing protein 3A n=1 Tax=Hoplias malabaricus TaxID=27720 RepID=UPI0034635757
MKKSSKPAGVSSVNSHKKEQFIRNSSDLQRKQELKERVAEWKSSAEWLEEFSLESCKLTLSHLLSHCSTTSTGLREDTQLEIGAAQLVDFEVQLYQAVETYHSRIQWLTQGSRKVFGTIKGLRLGVLIDSSDINCSEERLEDFQDSLLLLLDEQFSVKKQLHFLSFGTEVSSLWDRPRDVTLMSLQEAQQWVLQLRQSGKCNLLQALERVWSTAHALDSLLIILGSCPDQDANNIFTYITQSMHDKVPCVHIVAYNCSPVVIEIAKNIADFTKGRYHLFTPALGVVDSSSDLEPLWAEIKAARDVLHHIHNMRHGQLKDMTVSVDSEISTDLENLSLSDMKLEADDASAALCIQPPDPLPTTSAEWLKTNSLKAKKLGLYQMLAPNVYSSLEGFVPILGKTVHSTVHEKAMVQFMWHDGTMKNVHVDMSLLQNYQKRLLEAERVLEDRVMWLSSTGSHQIWGTICEQRVQILLDMSEMNTDNQLHIKYAVQLLLQEQLSSTHSFNIIVYGSDIKAWSDQMVPPTNENLQDVWQWIHGLECGGGRNTLAAVQHAIKAESNNDSSLTHGIYLLTTGLPDQDSVNKSAVVTEFCSGPGPQVHVCLFTREGSLLCQTPSHITWTETAEVLRGLAHAGNGRFHWITDTAIVESDDVIALIAEMEKAANYWQKCCELVDSLVQRSSSGDAEETQFQENSSPAQALGPRHKLPPPKPTKLSLARLEVRPKRDLSAHLATSWEPPRLVNSAKRRKEKISHSVFYLEDGGLGTVFKTYLKPRSDKKFVSTIKLPKHEDICSTKQWLRRFGIKTLKLDLHKLVSGPECTHRKKMVQTVHKSVSAKYCTIFPSVHFNGCVRHLLLSPGELKQYLLQTERILQRYIQRTQWLLSGSRRVFGCVLEKAVSVVLDVSGSMAPCLPELQKDLTSLIWEQFHTNRVRFSMVAFSGEVRVWQAELMDATEQRCKEAEHWLGQLSTHGETSTLNALQAGCAFEDSLGVYLVTDGSFDSSFSLVLKEAERLTAGKHITVHTIALNCQNSTARDFLKKLAHKTRGRFHQAPSHTDTATANDLLSCNFSEGEDSALPAFEGDDLRRLKEEIEKLRMFRKQAKVFREIILAKNPEVV